MLSFCLNVRRTKNNVLKSLLYYFLLNFIMIRNCNNQRWTQRAIHSFKPFFENIRHDMKCCCLFVCFH